MTKRTQRRTKLPTRDLSAEWWASYKAMLASRVENF